MPSTLTRLLAPASIAIVGVSAEDRGFGINGRTVLNHLIRHGYRGRIVPIHPRADEIAGYPTVRSLDQLPEPVDCALVAVPAPEVVEQLKQCAAVGVGGAVVLSSRFAEHSAAGAALQAEIADFVTKTGLPLCGPNTTGFVRVRDGLALSATASLQNVQLRAGPLGLVTQSGALGGALLARALDSGLGLSYLVGTGNEVSLTAADYVDYLLDDDETRVIGLYLEAFRDIDRFLAVADRADRVGKPLVAFKAGRTADGGQAAQSHTGSIAGQYDAYVAAMRRHGVVVANGLDDLIDTSGALVQTAQPDGNRVGVYTFSGALGVAVTDRLVEAGLELAQLSEHTTAALTDVFGPATVAHNPFDVAPNVYAGTNFRDSLQILTADPAVDITVLVLMPVAAERIQQVTEAIIDVTGKTGKPLLVMWYCGPAQPGLSALRAAAVPCLLSIEQCAATARQLVDRAAWRRAHSTVDGLTVTPVDEGHRAYVRDRLRGRTGPLSEWETRDILLRYGLPIVDAVLATSAEQAGEAATAFGGRVVVKVAAPAVTHKAAAGGVRAGLTGPAETAQAFDSIIAEVGRTYPAVALDGAIVQPFVDADVEVMLGLRMDLDVGPVVIFGQGGVLTEHIGDHALALCPRNDDEARELISRTRIGCALAALAPGWPAIRSALVTAILRLGELAEDVAGLLSEVEINPIRVALSGRVQAVDCLAVAALQSEAGAPARDAGRWQSPRRATKLRTLDEVVEWVADSALLGVGGVLHENKPVALLRALLRRGVKNLRVTGLAAGGYDIELLVAAGAVAETFLPAVLFDSIGLAPAFRAAVEQGMVIAHGTDAATLMAGYMASAEGLAFHPVAALKGTDIARVNPLILPMPSPVGDETLWASRAVIPDITFIHAQEADVYGNARVFGPTAYGENLLARASNRVVVGCDRLVSPESITGDPMRTTIPGMYVDAVVHLPYGAHPTSCPGRYLADAEHLNAYWRIAEQARHGGRPSGLSEYLERWVFEPRRHDDYLALVGSPTLRSLEER